MDIKKIILEEINDFNWVKGVPILEPPFIIHVPHTIDKNTCGRIAKIFSEVFNVSWPKERDIWVFSRSNSKDGLYLFLEIVKGEYDVWWSTNTPDEDRGTIISVDDFINGFEKKQLPPSLRESDFDWVKDVPATKPFKIGGFRYSNGKNVPHNMIMLGDTVNYIGDISFIVERVKIHGEIYDENNIHKIPTDYSENYVVVWGPQQPYPFMDDGSENWYDGNKAFTTDNPIK